MGTTQTAYGERMAPNPPGVIDGADYNTETCISETASPGIGFGLMTSRGSLSDQGVVLGGALADVRGILVRDVTLEPGDADKLIAPKSGSILSRGRIWVEPGEAVNDGDPVFFHGTTGVLYKAAGTGRVGPIYGARWVDTCGVSGRARVFLSGANNIPPIS